MARSSQARTGAALRGPSSEDADAAGNWPRARTAPGGSERLMYYLPLVCAECELTGPSLQSPRHFDIKERS